MLRKCLVTGGAGFIGSALVRRLEAEGHSTTVLDDMSRGAPRRLAGVSAGIVHGDVRDAACVMAAAEGCDTVIHLAAVNGTAAFYEQPRRVLDTAIRGTMNVLDACEKHGVRDLLLMSSSEAHQAAVVPTPEDVPLVVPDPLNPRFSYGGGKIAAELMAAAWQQSGPGRRLIIARPHNIYGPDAGCEHVIPQMAVRMAALAAAHRGGPVLFPVQGSGQETRAFCHITDCTAALMLLLEKAPETGIYHVGNPEEVTMESLAHRIGEWYGLTVKIRPGELPPGSPLRRCPDIGRLRGLGFEPRVMLADGLGPVLDWYRDNG